MEAFRIKCRTAPVGEVGPLIPRLDQSIPVLTLHILELRRCPKGLNIDGSLTFDMQSDGGVDGVEILFPLGSGLNSGTGHARPGEKYWRLFLEPNRKDVSEPEVELLMERIEDQVTFRFVRGDIDSKYLIGPGVTALVGDNELKGLSVELLPFRK